MHRRTFPKPPVGERRYQPNQLIKGGVLTVTKVARGKDGPRVHYTIRRNGSDAVVAGGWMLFSEWFRLKLTTRK